MRPEAGGCRRFCQHCDQSVHDLSMMSQAEADAFLLATEDLDICVAFRVDAEGRRVHRPRPATPALVPLERLRPRARPSSSRAWLPASMVGALAACTPHGQAESIPEPEDAPVLLEALDTAQRIPSAPAPKPEAHPPMDDLQTPCLSDESVAHPKRPPVRKGKRIRKNRGVRISPNLDDPLSGL